MINPMLIAKVLGYMKSALKTIISIAKTLWGMWANVDQKAFETIRKMGGVREQANQFRRTMLVAKAELGSVFNVGEEDFVRFQEALNNSTNKALIASKEMIKTWSALQVLVPQEAINQMTDSVDSMGGSFEVGAYWMELTRKRAQKLGIDTSKATTAVAKNMNAINKYSFKNGVDGLTKMSNLATRMKVDFESMAKSIDNFDTVENAIENSAKIQMLGGQMAAQFGNPLTVMNMAQNDAEGFIENLQETVKGLVTWHPEEGIAQIDSWVDRQRVKLMADAAGLNYDDVLKMATRGETDRQIEKYATASRMEEFEKLGIADYIRTTSQYNPENGKWEITAAGEQIDINSITPQQMAQLVSILPKDDVNDNVKDISMNVASILKQLGGEAASMLSLNERIDGIKKGIAASVGAGAEKLGMGTVGNAANDLAQDQLANERTTLGEFGNVIASGFNWVGDTVNGLWDKYVPFPNFMSPGKAFNLGGDLFSWASENVDYAVKDIMSYEGGGLVGGNLYTGDRILARVNSDEMIFNKPQQANLWKMANGNFIPQFDSYTTNAFENGLHNSTSPQYITNQVFRNQYGISQPTYRYNSYLDYRKNKALGADRLYPNQDLNTWDNMAIDKNVESNAIKSYTEGQHLQSQGEFTNNIAQYAYYRNARNAQKAAEAAKYGKMSIGLTYVPPLSGGLTDSSVLGFKTKRDYDLAEKWARKEVLTGKAKSMYIKDLSTNKVRTVNVVPKNFSEHLTKIFADFSKNQKAAFAEFKQTNIVFRKSTELYKSASEGLKTFKGKVRANTIGRAAKFIRSSAPFRYAQSVRAAYVLNGGAKGIIQNSAVGRAVTSAAQKTSNLANRTVSLVKNNSITKLVGTTAKNTISLVKGVGTAAAKGITRVVTAPVRLASKAVSATKPILSKAGKLAQPLTSKLGSVAKLGGKRIPIIGTAIALAGGIMEGMGAAKEFDARKQLIEGRTDLTSQQKKQMLRSAEDERNSKYGKAAGSTIGTIVGGALGSFLGPVGTVAGSIAGEWIGGKIGGFVGKQWNNVKDAVFGSKPEMSLRDQAQQAYEETKFGKTDITDPQLYEKAALATVKIHDTVISMWYHMNGRASNGEEVKKGLIGNIGNIVSNVGSAVGTMATMPLQLAASGIKAVSNFVSPSQNTQVQSLPTVGLPTPVVPSFGVSTQSPKVNGDINLNVNGTLKLDVPSANKSIDIDFNKLLESPEFKRQIMDIVTTEYSKVGGIANRDSSYSKTPGALSWLNYK